MKNTCRPNRNIHLEESSANQLFVDLSQRRRLLISSNIHFFMERLTQSIIKLDE